MPNPSGINQYSQGGGGDRAHEQTHGTNAHPQHRAVDQMSRKEATAHIASVMRGARSEGFSVKGSLHGDR